MDCECLSACTRVCLYARPTARGALGALSYQMFLLAQILTNKEQIPSNDAVGCGDTMLVLSKNVARELQFLLSFFPWGHESGTVSWDRGGTGRWPRG